MLETPRVGRPLALSALLCVAHRVPLVDLMRGPVELWLAELYKAFGLKGV